VTLHDIPHVHILEADGRCGLLYRGVRALHDGVQPLLVTDAHQRAAYGNPKAVFREELGVGDDDDARVWSALSNVSVKRAEFTGDFAFVEAFEPSVYLYLLIVLADVPHVPEHPGGVHAVRNHLFKSGVVAADAYGHQSGVVAQSVQLRSFVPGSFGYIQLGPVNYNVPMKEIGVPIVTDYKEYQKGVQGNVGGALQVEGGHF